MPSSAQPSYNEYMRNYMAARRERRRRKLVEMLGGVCVDCGSIDRLEFDHLDREAKEGTIASMLDVAWDALVAEALKCVLRCHDCHVKRTREQLGHGSRHEHGTITSYAHAKCRCDACRLAWSSYQRGRRKGKPRTEPQHGEYRKYRAGCRCNPCRAANAARCRDYQRSRR